jgi:protein-S-isoprenylcysteine O-methyltransferase Ste14
VEPTPRIIPPVWLLICAIGALLAERQSPQSWIFLPDTARIAGFFVVLLGLGLVVNAGRRFRRAETSVIAGSIPNALVMGGIYKRTRNPMYLGMLLVLVGEAMMLGSPFPFLAPIVFFIAVTRNFIFREEALLEQIFEDVYREYKSRVRRWI